MWTDKKKKHNISEKKYNSHTWWWYCDGLWLLCCFRTWEKPVLLLSTTKFYRILPSHQFLTLKFQAPFLKHQCPAILDVYLLQYSWFKWFIIWFKWVKPRKQQKQARFQPLMIYFCHHCLKLNRTWVKQQGHDPKHTSLPPKAKWKFWFSQVKIWI